MKDMLFLSSTEKGVAQRNGRGSWSTSVNYQLHIIQVTILHI